MKSIYSRVNLEIDKIDKNSKSLASLSYQLDRNPLDNLTEDNRIKFLLHLTALQKVIDRLNEVKQLIESR